MTEGAAHGPGIIGSGSENPGRFFSMPHSVTGRWAVASAALFLVFMTVFYGLVVADVGVGETAQKWPLWSMIIPAAVSGWAAAVLGIEALLRRHERSALVFVSVVIGLLVALFTLGEFFTAH